MLEMLSKRPIHKVDPETLTNVVAGYSRDKKMVLNVVLSFGSLVEQPFPILISYFVYIKVVV